MDREEEVAASWAVRSTRSFPGIFVRLGIHTKLMLTKDEWRVLKRRRIC